MRTHEGFDAMRDLYLPTAVECLLDGASYAEAWLSGRWPEGYPPSVVPWSLLAIAICNLTLCAAERIAHRPKAAAALTAPLLLVNSAALFAASYLPCADKVAIAAGLLAIDAARGGARIAAETLVLQLTWGMLEGACRGRHEDDFLYDEDWNDHE